MLRSSRFPGRGRLVLGLVLLSTHAIADEVCHTVVVPTTATPVDVEIAIPQFDPALGVLTRIDVSLALESVAVAQLESVASGFAGDLVPGVEAQVLASDSTVLAVASATDSIPLTLGAYDGVLDYAGTSGFSMSESPLPDAGDLGSTSDSGTLDLFSGSPGGPNLSGTRVRIHGIGSHIGVGSVDTQFSSSASVTVVVCYVYTPRITSLCAGDGTGTACPCDNFGAAGEGCQNSFGYGSRLEAVGVAAPGSDTLVLSATVPGTNAAMFYQGTTTQNGGAGVLFGDGLRCTGGTVIRLTSTSAVGGIATYPGSSDPAVSVAGEVAAGATRYYQVWYRNSASFCTEQTFNLSNALRIDWIL